MIFNKPIWAPNMILVDAPKAGVNGLDIALDVLKAIPNRKNVIGIFASNRIVDIEREKIIIEQYDYSIYRESDKEKPWLRSKFLKGGAKIVYYIVSPEKEYRAAIVNVYDLINTEYPVICVSEFLSHEIMPAAMIVPSVEDKEKAIAESVPAAIDGKIITITDFERLKVFFENQAFRIE